MDSALLIVIIVLSSLFILCCAPIIYISLKLAWPPRNSIDSVSGEAGKRIIVCLGDSHTHGRYGYNWVGNLASTLMKNTLIVNAGRNGRHAVGGIVELEKIKALHPTDVVVLLGTNDVITQACNLNTPAYSTSLKASGCDLQAIPSPEAYSDVMSEILALNARLIVINIPIVTENLNNECNKLVEVYNSHLEHVAQEKNATLIDFHSYTKSLVKESETEGLTHSLSDEEAVSLSRIFIGGFRSVVAGHYRHGGAATVDGVHLNETAGKWLYKQVLDTLS